MAKSDFKRGLDRAAAHIEEILRASYSTGLHEAIGNLPEIIRNLPEEYNTKTDLEQDFETFWETMPKRIGPNPKKPARVKYEVIIKRKLATVEEILMGAHRFAASQPNPEFTAQVLTWLNQERWRDTLWVATPKRSALDVVKRLNGHG